MRASLLPRPVGSPRASASRPWRGDWTDRPHHESSTISANERRAHRRKSFCSTSPRTAPWCILSYCMNQSSEDPDRRCRSQGQGYQSTREVGTRCTSDRPGTRLLDELLLQSVSYRCMTGAHTTDCTYSPFPVQHPSEDEGRRRGHPMIRLGLNDPC